MVLSHIMDIYRHHDAVMVYLSDHGEQVYDGPDHHYGREFGGLTDHETLKNVFEIPFLSVSLDASKRECTNVMSRDSVTWPTICDGMMFDSPAVEKLGIKGVPDNIVFDKKGKIIGMPKPPY